MRADAEIDGGGIDIGGQRVAIPRDTGCGCMLRPTAGAERRDRYIDDVAPIARLTERVSAITMRR